MAEIVLFHHIQGLTPGVTALADQLRAAGHTVHLPDLFEGRTFDSIEEGFGHAQGVGFDELGKRADRAVQDLPAGVVWAGISAGVMNAQRLAQTRAGARGALLLEACVPPSEFGAWPAGLPAQVHGMDHDPFFAGEGDLDGARELVAAVGPDVAELFTYPGDKHLFTDSSLPSYDAEATKLVTERILGFLDRL